MEKKKLDWIIGMIREDMGTASLPTNHTGKQIANFDPLMGKIERRKKPQIIGKGKFPGLRKRWSGKDES